MKYFLAFTFYDYFSYLISPTGQFLLIVGMYNYTVEIYGLTEIPERSVLFITCVSVVIVQNHWQKLNCISSSMRIDTYILV